MMEEAEAEAANQVDMKKVEKEAIDDLLLTMKLSLTEVGISNIKNTEGAG